jgi:nucleoside-diphosphate kinase
MAIERTLAIIKPDGTSRNIIGDVISRFERAGLRPIALKIINADMKLLKRHYPDTMAQSVGEKSAKAGEEEAKANPQAYGMKVLSWLRDFMSSGPVVPMVLEGENAISAAREIAGYTDPSAAKPGTIRRDFSTDSILAANKEKRPVKNVVHLSGNPEEAKTEIAIWFGSKEFVKR